MAANQTIIQAAKAAYTRPKVDISGQLQSMAAISKSITAMAKAASERVDELSKAYNAVDWLDNKDLESFGLSIRNSKDLSHKEKLEIFINLKNSTNKLETWSKNVESLFVNGGAELSLGNDEKTTAWLSTILTGDFFGEDFDFDGDGKPGITGEDGNILQPLKIDPISKDLVILNSDGEYTSINKLQTIFIKTSDGEGIYDQIRESGETIKKGRLKDQHIKREMSGIKKLLINENNKEAFIYDHPILIPLTEEQIESRQEDIMLTEEEKEMESIDQTFVDYFLENSSLWDDIDQEIMEEINSKLESLEWGEPYDWDGDGDIDPALTGDEKKRFKASLFREIISYGIDYEKDLNSFIQSSIEYDLKDL